MQNERIASWRNGQRALVLAVLRQPDANTVDVVDGVRASLPGPPGRAAAGRRLDVMLDRSASIRAAVHDVQESLVIAIGLVVLVCFLFLRRLSATLIPTVAVPISLCVAFGLMYALGYGIDNVTLLGLTIAVGLVVDDAIVVLEAIVRHIEEGMAPIQAAIRGSREIGFTVLSITLSLIAVFLPILLMGGVVGRVFNAFAATVSLAVLASCVVSLTLTPLMASRLRAVHRPGLVDRALERGVPRHRARLCLAARPGAALALPRLARLLRLDRRRRLDGGDHPEGLLPDRGHRPPVGQHGRAARRLHGGHGGDAGPAGRDLPPHRPMW